MSLRKSGSQVFLLLAVLSRDELEELRVFLRMPSVRGGGAMHSFLDFCVGLHPAYPEEAVQKEAVHEVLFPDQPYKEKRIRSLFSDLSIRIRDFLAWKAFEREQALPRVLLVRELRRRGLVDHAHKEGRRFLQDAFSGLGARADLYRFQIRDLLFQDDDSREELLFGAHGDLDRYFVLSKLRLTALVLSRRGFLSGLQPELLAFLDEVKRYAAEGGAGDLPRIYHLLLPLLEGAFDEVVFRKVKGAFLESVPELAPEDRRVLYQCLINIALRVINEGGTSFVRESWELYKAGLENGLVFTAEGELSDVTFTNIAVNGANLGEFEWTDRFIQDYATHLAPKVRDNAVALGRAYWYYNQAHYDKVIELLRDVHYSSAAYNLRGRSLLLRTYFDQGMAGNWVFSLQLFYHIEAFRRFLQRDKTLAASRKLGYQNLLNFTLALVQAVSRQKSAAVLEILEQEITAASQVIARDWLLQRLAGARGVL